MWQFLPSQIPADSEQNQANLSQLHGDKPVQFAACEVVFSEAHAACQQSSCCSQHRPGLAFSDEISIPAWRWQYNHDMTSCLGARPPSGSCSRMANKENNTGKMCPRLSPATEVRAALMCGNSHLAVPPHPHPPLSLCQSHPWAAGLSPWGLQLGVFVLQPGCGEQHRGLCSGRADLAGPAVRNSRAPAPLPAPRPADLVLTPQLTSWLLYIYFSPPCSLLSPCLSQKQQHRRTGSSSRHLPKMLV